jgi:hypothetical protein
MAREKITKSSGNVFTDLGFLPAQMSIPVYAKEPLINVIPA